MRSRHPGVARLCCTPGAHVVFNVSEVGPVPLNPGCFPAGMGMLVPILVGLGLAWCCLVPLVVPGCALHIPVPCWDCPCHAGIAPLSFPSTSFHAISPKIPPGGAWGCPPFWVLLFFTCGCWVFLYFKSNLARRREVSSSDVSRSTHLPSWSNQTCKEQIHLISGEGWRFLPASLSATRAQGRTGLGTMIFPGVFEHLETPSCCSQRAAAITLKGVSASICCGTTTRGAAPFAARGCSCLETCWKEQLR